MNHIPVLFMPQMSVDSRGFSPSASKPALVVADWVDAGLPIKVSPFEPVTVEDLCSVHSRAYVKGVLAGEIANGHGNTYRRVSRSCLWTVGSFVAAAEQAAQNGRVACSPTSGFHHAHYDSGRGFCTFNGLMVAAWKMRALGWSVAIIDCDAHFGDGTQNILSHFQLQDDVHHWTYGRQIPGEFEWDRFEEQIRGFIRVFLNECQRQQRILFYQAGADSHVDDPMGPGEHGMYDSEMRQRDRLIFELCREHSLPIVWNLAGGYQRDGFGGIPKVLELHRATMEECVRCFCDPELPGEKSGSL